MDKQPYSLRAWKGKLWTEVKSPQTIQRGGGICFFCGSQKRLLAHHLQNKPDIFCIAGWDTVCVCGHCHRKVCHSNRHWVDHPEVMKRRNRWWFIWWVRTIVLIRVFKKKLKSHFPDFHISHISQTIKGKEIERNRKGNEKRKVNEIRRWK